MFWLKAEQSVSLKSNSAFNKKKTISEVVDGDLKTRSVGLSKSFKTVGLVIYYIKPRRFEQLSGGALW